MLADGRLKMLHGRAGAPPTKPPSVACSARANGSTIVILMSISSSARTTVWPRFWNAAPAVFVPVVISARLVVRLFKLLTAVLSTFQTQVAGISL